MYPSTRRGGRGANLSRSVRRSDRRIWSSAFCFSDVRRERKTQEKAESCVEQERTRVSIAARGRAEGLTEREIQVRAPEQVACKVNKTSTLTTPA